MTSSQPSADLVTALKSEVLGTASFHTAYRLSLSRNKRIKARALWQLEAQTLERIEQYYGQKGFRRPRYPHLQLGGLLAGLLFPVLPWRSIMGTTLKETGYYLDVFKRLAEQAPSGERALFDYVVAHEEAIARFAELELAGDSETSLRPVLALLESA